MMKGTLTLMTMALALILAGCGGGGGSGNNSGNASGNASSGSTSAASYGQTSSTGSVGGASSHSTTSGSTAAAQQKGETVAVAKNSKLNSKILVDEDGKSLYLFEADKGGNSACSSACAQVWPPVTTKGKPQAGKGISTSKLGTITRSNGSTQVTYNGHPLYYYAPDSRPGDVKGEGLKQFGAEWYVLSPAGQKVEEGGS